ncbi:hypothetical protein UFOVP1264_14 [uncultured Caudovirales phage]|uniref:Uncharacterized protein n=1 Tax=uncultured Caudovirales phage TaxID=2100421 RepID=A0A6J5RC25_9CAUD|nr:hypothetical protein UFOVP1264_14 [uncultured Caudovirales phage]
MCASCDCGCKPGKPEKSCKCSCAMCKKARMSVEKSFLVSKAIRDLSVIADAYVVEEDDISK